MPLTTFTPGTAISSSAVNANFTLVTPLFVRAIKTANQTITTGVRTKLTFTSEIIDTGSDFASSTWTAPAAGTVRVHCRTVWISQTNEYVMLFPYKNGAAHTEDGGNVTLFFTGHDSGPVGSYHVAEMDLMLTVAASDTIEVYTEHSLGSDWACIFVPGTYLEIQFVAS